MAFKYTFILLLGLCSSVLGMASEEEVRQWLDETIKMHWEICKDKISEESLQDLKDDMEADNEEIRDFRLCIAVHHEYLKMSKIDVAALLADFRKYAKNVTDEEVDLAEKMLNICKDEGEEQTQDKDIVGKFITCVLDRCKSAI